jgi:Fe-only nitrogenase accessory protein AnfO
MKIAALVDQQGATADLFHSVQVRLYHNPQGQWQVLHEITFLTEDTMSMTEIRSSLLGLQPQLEGCQHLIARSIHGFARSILDGMGLAMWGLEGDPGHVLEQIRLRAQARQPDIPPQTLLQATATPGCYRVNLQAALAQDNRLTSKQLLHPILDQHPFDRLEILCDHVPKWFEREFPARQLNLRVDCHADGSCIAIVSRSKA